MLTIAAFLMVAALGIGMGGYESMLAVPMVASTLAESSKKVEEKPAPGLYTPAAYLKELPPIVTNLVSPSGVWIRVEASVVFEPANTPDYDVLLREISADFLNFLRTVSLAQLQGASGLQHLRQDLSERMAIRSKGKARELIIHSLVVQ